MDHHTVQGRFATLTTTRLADACIRAQLPVRCAPALLRPVVPGSGWLGVRARPGMRAASMSSWRRSKRQCRATSW